MVSFYKRRDVFFQWLEVFCKPWKLELRSVWSTRSEETIMVREITSKAEFDAVLASAGDKLVVVDFTATWCGPCKMIGPVFEELSVQHKDKVIFIKVDVDEAADVSSDCGINCMPTFHFYKNGQKVFEFSGANQETLRKKVVELQ
ncbi:thioredoxin-like [Nematolebias whitei]|uniref:thioredoxin-like n=1 Tax=Nematolebias whitei TaxID=451745 RepID=UPI00189A1683|nr:thioredoxin-like [Nematolebias whitei]